MKVPGGVSHFIEIMALSYSHCGNDWMPGVYGKGFRADAMAE